MIIMTATGSQYEFDQTNKQVRRLSGAKSPTPRTGIDGEWREYLDISEPTIGQSVVILWTSATPLLEGSDPNNVPMTITSPVQSIVKEGSVLS